MKDITINIINTTLLIALVAIAVPAQAMIRSSMQRLATPARVGLVRSNMLAQRKFAKPVMPTRFFSNNAVGPVAKSGYFLGARPLSQDLLNKKHGELIQSLIAMPASKGIPALQTMLAAKAGNVEATEKLNHAIRQARARDFVEQVKSAITTNPNRITDIIKSVSRDELLDSQEKKELIETFSLMQQGKQLETKIRTSEKHIALLEAMAKINGDYVPGVGSYHAPNGESYYSIDGHRYKKGHIPEDVRRLEVDALLAEEKLSEINQKIHDRMSEQTHNLFESDKPESPVKPELSQRGEAPAKVTDAEVVNIK